MFHVEKVASLDAPDLQPYRTMRRQQEHRAEGIFVAEGEKVVRRLLESRFTVRSLLLPQKWVQELQPLLEARSETVRVYVAEKKLLESLTGFSMYQGLLAVGQVPPPLEVQSILANASRPWLVVATEGLSNAENLGALVRNCVAFKVQALLVGETCSSPYLRRAVRSSMGTIFLLPVVETRSLTESLRALRTRGLRCIAAHPHARGRILPQADLRSDCCLVFGSEGHGLSDSVLSVCDETVAIPMPPEVDSLNVGSAGGIFLYEASRQRSAL